MRLTLKDFQEDAVADLVDNVRTVQGVASSAKPMAVLLNAPTAAGKTIMMTAVIERLLDGDEDDDGNPELTFVWLTDDPELNLQSLEKVTAATSVLTALDVLEMNNKVDQQRLDSGKLYFLNTQKLGTGTSYVKKGDGRSWTFWETLANTADDLGPKLVLVIDEAHRGAKGTAAADAETIMQKFIKGDAEIDKVPVVVGVSATPDRFVKLCNAANRPLFQVDVDPASVRESGLLKEWVDLFHPDEAVPNDATVLVEGIASWQEYEKQWDAYEVDEGEVAKPPILLIQVEDAKKGSNAVSQTDLDMVVGTLAKQVPHDKGDDRWIAHAFQEEGPVVAAGHSVRKLAPSRIEADPDVKVVLFKTSLNTGWDCPRAETMVSFRTAKDPTNIAQLVGRMVRTPLARRVEDNEHLNTVALYLPRYHRQTVEKVVGYLTSADGIPSVEVRHGKDAVTLHRAAGMEDCFTVLGKLPTYTVPRIRTLRPVVRLARLASLLAELELMADPVKEYRAALVQVLLDECAELTKDPAFKKQLEEAALLDLRRRRIGYGVQDQDPEDENDDTKKVAVADKNVDDLYEDAGRRLGEGLHREYLRERLEDDSNDARTVKLELHAIVTTGDSLAYVEAAADALRKKWTDDYKAAIRDSGEKYKVALRDIEGAGPKPTLTEIDPPHYIEANKAEKAWPKHLYVEKDGKYREDFRSSWERKVVEHETAKEEVVGWLRNVDRKPWAICATRQAGTKWVGIYPDFVFFRKTVGGVLADIVDPHLLSDEHAPARAAALARFAGSHGESFGRIEMVIYEDAKDEAGRRIDLLDEELRTKVAGATTHAHLRQIFESV